MGVGQLTLLSVGATLGTGIFVVLGEAVPEAGPAIVVSFLPAGVTALSYAEPAGMIPGSGSSYSYTCATLGELVARVCGWCHHGAVRAGGRPSAGPAHPGHRRRAAPTGAAALHPAPGGSVRRPTGPRPEVVVALD